MERQHVNEPPDVSRRELKIEHYVALVLIAAFLIAGGVWLLAG